MKITGSELLLRIEAAVLLLAMLAQPVTFATAAFGQAAPDFRVAGWIISQDEHGCRMTNGYDNGQGLEVRLDHRLGEAATILVDPSFKSLVEGKKYSLDITFQSGKTLRDDFEDVTFMPLVGASANAVAARMDAYEFLPALARNDSIIILRGNAFVAKLSLKGSAEAVRALKHCARAVANVNPSDPLE